MENPRRLSDDLSSIFGEFLREKADDLKRKAVTGLSEGFSRFLSILIMVVLLMIVLAAFAFGFILLLGDLIGSQAGAAFIVGGVYLAAFAVLFFLRKRLFTGMFVRLFTGIIEDDTSSDDWKSLVLIIVRHIRARLE